MFSFLGRKEGKKIVFKAVGCRSANWTKMAHDRVQRQVFNYMDSFAIWINTNCLWEKRVSKTVIAAICPTSAKQWVGVHDADMLTAVAVHVLPPGNTDWACSSFLFLCAAAWWHGAGSGLLHVSHNTCCCPLPQLSQHALAPYGHLAILLSSPSLSNGQSKQITSKLMTDEVFYWV